MSPMLKWIKKTCVLSLGFWLVVPASRADTNHLLSIDLRPGVYADIQAQVLDNPVAPSGGRTVLIQHGLAHTGNTARPMAERIFATPAVSAKVAKVVLLDMPGHGGSSLPAGVLYGELGLQDYATALIESIAALQALGVQVDTLVSHSMGGSIVQLAQDRLVSQGTNLRNRFGIDRSVFLSPSLSADVPWVTADLLVGTLLAVPHLRYSAELGNYVEVSPLVWNVLFNTNLVALPVPGTPSISTINNQGYIAIEPYRATSELLGIPGTPRLPVAAGIFGDAYGTVSRLVTNNQDKNVLPFEERANYRHLTGDNTDARFMIINRLDASHDMYLTNPQAMIDLGIYSDL